MGKDNWVESGLGAGKKNTKYDLYNSTRKKKENAKYNKIHCDLQNNYQENISLAIPLLSF